MLRSRAMLALLLGIALSGCGDDEPVTTENFRPLHYDYLTKLRLNVGDIEVQDHTASLGPDDVSAQSPSPPAQAMVQMAHDRLFAAGSSGQAVFTIDQASITRAPGDTLNGTLAAHLDVLTAGGARAAFAEARVSRQHVPGSDAENQRAVLYDMTRQMMDDMNVELEFQMRRTLGDWMVSANASPAPVAVQSLPPAATPPASAPVPAGPATPALPPATPAPDGIQLSPPPGYLHLPPATPQGAAPQSY